MFFFGSGPKNRDSKLVFFFLSWLRFFFGSFFSPEARLEFFWMFFLAISCAAVFFFFFFVVVVVVVVVVAFSSGAVYIAGNLIQPRNTRTLGLAVFFHRKVRGRGGFC